MKQPVCYFDYAAKGKIFSLHVLSNGTRSEGTAAATRRSSQTREDIMSVSLGRMIRSRHVEAQSNSLTEVFRDRTLAVLCIAENWLTLAKRMTLAAVSLFPCGRNPFDEPVPLSCRVA